LDYKLDGIYPVRGFDHRQLLERFNLHPLRLRRSIFLVKFLHGLVNGLIDSPALLSSIFFLVPRHSTRYSQTFFLPRPRSNMLLKSPLYVMCDTFNKISHLCDINVSPINAIVGAIIDMYYRDFY